MSDQADMSGAMQKLRAQQWLEATEQFGRMTDALGTPLDEGIRETVIALNVLGVSTLASCYGHLDRGQASPWIEVGDPGARPLARVAMLKLQRAEQACARGAHEDERHARKAEAETAVLDVRRLHLVERAKLLHLLDGFYRQRLVAADRRLIITALDWMGSGRLESQGTDHQVVAPPEERASRLIEYQDEMRQFTAFLKALFFGTHL